MNYKMWANFFLISQKSFKLRIIKSKNYNILKIRYIIFLNKFSEKYYIVDL